MANRNDSPNHICKYSGCHYGEDGNRKHYYACPDCDRYFSWRSMGCSFEHYMAYQNEVAMARNSELPFPEAIEAMVIDGVIKKPEPSVDKIIDKSKEDTKGSIFKKQKK